MTASLLPPNSTELERALEAVAARVDGTPVPLRRLWNPSTARLEDELAYLAWALSIDAWSNAWPEAVRRQRVRQAMAIQRRKGTAESVRSVVESFGGAIALREWWQMAPPGEPHTFEIVLTLNGEGGAEASAEFTEAVIAEVARTKPVRSHFTFTQGLKAAGGIAVIGAVRPAVYARLLLDAPVDPQTLTLNGDLVLINGQIVEMHP